MSRSHRCIVVLEREPQRGSWNMAVDEALLESALESGDCYLRWYRWSEPTLSLGYFQQSSEINPDLAELSVVRRLTGGGAIVHHHELTYCCAIPPGHELACDPLVLYEAVHDRITSVLTRHGAPVRMRGEDRRSPTEPFLCFSRGDARDIVLKGTKVVGSAQRRRRGAVMQHGSVILERSQFAPALPGLRDLAPGYRWCETLAEEMAREIAPLLCVESDDSELPAPVERRARGLEAARYSTLDWSGSRATGS